MNNMTYEERYMQCESWDELREIASSDAILAYAFKKEELATIGDAIDKVADVKGWQKEWETYKWDI